MNAIQIGHRTFALSTRTGRDGKPQYVLTGKRGATYVTERNIHHPDRMFLIDNRGFGLAKGYEGVWFSDATGELVQVK